jgi:hypothetical protein
MFDATLGRFLERDPQGTVAGINVYQYAGGRPTNATDPLGLAWKEEDLWANIKKCDPSKRVFDEALKVSRGKAPSIVPGKGGSVEATEKKGFVITLTKDLDTCDATQQLVFELTNMANAAKFNDLDKRCEAGDVSREDYIKENERLEYVWAAKNAINAFDSCKKMWGCNNPCRYEWARPPEGKTYEEYFETAFKKVSAEHKEHYGKIWDDDCKTEYNRKHPPKK